MTTTWTGSTSGSSFWDVGGNWSTGIVPGAGAGLAILGTGPFTVVISNSDPSYTIRSLSLGSAVTLQVLGRLSVANAVNAAAGSTLDIAAAGSVSASSLDLTAMTVIDQGLLTISGTASGNGTIDVQGGSLFVNSIAGIDSYDLTGNANMTISSSTGASGAIVFGDTSPITLNLNNAGAAFGASITGFGATDTIDIGSLAYAKGDSVSVSGTTLSISNGGRTIFTFGDFNSPGHVRLENDGNGGTELYTCFVAGTRILTELGEVAVEDLAVQDRVATLVGAELVFRPIRWIGSRHLDRSALRRTGAHPVRFLAGSVSDGVPHRDLLVTPEHCILLDGRLIPARMLVNGRSIFVDRSVGAFSFHHVELDEHGILIAEGLTAESYLDTGNRRLFATGSGPAEPAPEGQVRDACAPLRTDRASVEPLWRRLDARAAVAGWPDQRPGLDLTDDPRLRLRLEGGRELEAAWEGDGRHIFHIPQGARPTRLLSRMSVPATVLGAYVDDRRVLGVQVSMIVWWNGLADTCYPASGLALEGWHAEENASRWTDGAARLELPAATSSDTFLDVRVVGTVPYQRPVAFQRLAA